MASHRRDPASKSPPMSEAEIYDVERGLPLAEWNDTRADYPRDATLHRVFEAQAAKTPDAAALVFEETALSYDELNRRANQLAHYLRGIGVGPEALVGVFMERSLEMVIALYGILKAGGAYVPLDPEYPPERVTFMLSDTRAPVLLTQRHLAARLPHTETRVICLDAEAELFAGGEPHANLDGGATAENLAYVIYTSGSTGRPKGVMNEHRGICNRLFWMQDAYCLRSDDRILQKTPFSFDVSVWEFFWPLMYGACLVIARPEGHRNSEYLRTTIVDHKITTVHFVPSMLRVFLQEPELERCVSLRRVICSGEALPSDLVQRYFSRVPAELHNLYGPTEAAVDVTHWTCRRGDEQGSIPIGRPVANTTLYILDEQLRPVPVGATGELHIGGIQVARGYLNRPELTAERFINDPFSDSSGARLYKTGDLARYRADGNIEYLGRLDFQVKIRGFRIELGEIESTLLQHESVCEVVVTAREDRPGDKRLVAYLVLHKDAHPPSVGDLRSFLLQTLPEHMVPATFVTLTAIPLTLNGKVDRNALPAPGTDRPELENAYVLPRTPLEEFLAICWQEALGIDPVGIHDNYFELGGDSIQGATIINRLQQRLDEYVYIVALFEAPTICELAAYLAAHYPESVLRVFGADSLDAARPVPGSPAGGRIDATTLADFRRLIGPDEFVRQLDDTGGAKNRRAIFVLAPPRSGSTLLRVMLGGHPELFAPQELELLLFRTLREMQEELSGKHSFWIEGTLRTIMEFKECGLDDARRFLTECVSADMTTKEFYGLIQGSIEPSTLVDKTPSYALHLDVLRKMETDFQDPLYIHLLRHPCAMIDSFENVKLDQVFFRQDHEYSTRQLAELIWLVSHENISEFLRGIPEKRKLRISFEEIVSTPRAAMQQICGFLGLGFHEEMLRPYDHQDGKMTDGVHGVSKMRGDPKFHKYHGIDATASDRWRQEGREDFLGEITWRAAESLGYPRETTKDSPHTSEQLGPAAPSRGEAVERDKARNLLAEIDHLSDEQVASLLSELSDR